MQRIKYNYSANSKGKGGEDAFSLSHPAEREETKRRGCVFAPFRVARALNWPIVARREDWLLLRDVNASSLHCAVIWLFISPPSVFFTQPKRDSITFNALAAWAQSVRSGAVQQWGMRDCVSRVATWKTSCVADRDPTADVAYKCCQQLFALCADLPMQLVCKPVFLLPRFLNSHIQLYFVFDSSELSLKLLILFQMRMIRFSSPSSSMKAKLSFFFKPIQAIDDNKFHSVRVF